MLIRRAEQDDLGAMVALAVDAQRDPERFCAYVGEDAVSIEADIAGLVGPGDGDWTTATWVAIDVDLAVGAWLLTETDPEMGRVWWWGPMVADAARLDPDQRDSTIDALFAAATNGLDGYTEHELVGDQRSTRLASFARRHDFVTDAASALLRTEPLATSEWAGDDGVIAINDRHFASVSELHDELFPGTHTSGDKLVESDAVRVRLVVEADRSATSARDSSVIGYIATEAQSDGSLYIDFLGVVPEQRGRGIGRRLVTEAMRRGADRGATHAHLTVRTENTSARRLYASLGFVEERVIVPYRRGFLLR